MVADPELVNGQEADADLGLYLDFNSATAPNGPQPIRGELGSTDPGPRTFEYEKLNPDLYAPPGTDTGDVPNAMWPLGLSHNRPGTGNQSGWARQQNEAVLPAATAMAGVDMRLAPQYVFLSRKLDFNCGFLTLASLIAHIESCIGTLQLSGKSGLVLFRLVILSLLTSSTDNHVLQGADLEGECARSGDG